MPNRGEGGVLNFCVRGTLPRVPSLGGTALWRKLMMEKMIRLVKYTDRKEKKRTTRFNRVLTKLAPVCVNMLHAIVFLRGIASVVHRGWGQHCTYAVTSFNPSLVGQSTQPGQHGVALKPI